MTFFAWLRWSEWQHTPAKHCSPLLMADFYKSQFKDVKKSFCLQLRYRQKTCRRLALVSCKSCSSGVGEAVSPGMPFLDRCSGFWNERLIFFFFFSLFLCIRDVEAVHHTGGCGARWGGQESRGFTQQAGFCQHCYGNVEAEHCTGCLWITPV